MFQARANVTIGRTFMRLWTVADLPESPERDDCERIALIVRQSPDGTYPSPVIPEPARCCGG